MVVRSGRLQWPGASHAYGQVPARIAADVILGKEIVDRASFDIVPRVTFTDPQVCAVGLTEDQARERAMSVRVVTYPTERWPARTCRATPFSGTSKLVIDESRGVVVGATFTGPGVQELLHSATVAIAGAVPSTCWPMPCPPSRRSARCGYACSRNTGCNPASIRLGRKSGGSEEPLSKVADQRYQLRAFWCPVARARRLSRLTRLVQLDGGSGASRKRKRRIGAVAEEPTTAAIDPISGPDSNLPPVT